MVGGFVALAFPFWTLGLLQDDDETRLWLREHAPYVEELVGMAFHIPDDKQPASRGTVQPAVLQVVSPYVEGVHGLQLPANQAIGALATQFAAGFTDADNAIDTTLQLNQLGISFRVLNADYLAPASACGLLHMPSTRLAEAISDPVPLALPASFHGWLASNADIADRSISLSLGVDCSKPAASATAAAAVDSPSALMSALLAEAAAAGVSSQQGAAAQASKDYHRAPVFSMRSSISEAAEALPSGRRSGWLAWLWPQDDTSSNRAARFNPAHSSEPSLPSGGALSDVVSAGMAAGPSSPPPFRLYQPRAARSAAASWVARAQARSATAELQDAVLPGLREEVRLLQAARAAASLPRRAGGFGVAGGPLPSLPAAASPASAPAAAAAPAS